MSDEWWAIESGEYVLGTLRGPERELFEKILERDPEAQALVLYWEEQFAMLDTELPGEQYGKLVLPHSVWQNIEALIDRERDTGRDEEQDAQLSPPLNTVTGAERDTDPRDSSIRSDKQVRTGPATDRYSSSSAHSESTDDRHRLSRWKAFGSLSFAASLILGSVLIAQTLGFVSFNGGDPAFESARSVDGDYTVVSVLGSEDGNQLWIIVADDSNGQVRAIAVDPPEARPDRSHQLWVVLPEDQGVQSIGVLPYGQGASESFDVPDKPSRENLQQGVAFAVSVEPPGGTEQAAPTGPVISSQGYTRLGDPL